MNYSRGMQPSCTSKAEYEAQNRKRWKRVKETPPAEGAAVVILLTHGEQDSDFWTTEIAYYCDGQFYNLEYDPHLGILRKQHVSEPVEYWATWWTWSIDELI